jgi:transposase
MQLPPLPHSNEALKTLATTLTQQLAEREAAIAVYSGIIATREQELAAQKQQIAELSILNEKLKFELARYRRLRFGRHSEAIGSEQMKLWEAELEADIAALRSRMQRAQEAIAPDLKTHEKVTPKRAPLPDHLPRVEKRLEPESTVCACGRPMARIGEDVAETLQVIPAKFYVERRIRGKWTCRCCESLAMAPVPPAPIERAIAGSSLLAQVIVAKYQDHLPLHRQEGIYARMGVEIPRSTMAGWLGQLEVGVAP